MSAALFLIHTHTHTQILSHTHTHTHTQPQSGRAPSDRGETKSSEPSSVCPRLPLTAKIAAISQINLRAFGPAPPLPSKDAARFLVFTSRGMRSVANVTPQFGLVIRQKQD